MVAESMKPSIGVMTVATNRYIEYWAQMAASADRHLFPDHRLVLHVFTDQAARAQQIAATLQRAAVDVVEIQPLGWPEDRALKAVGNHHMLANHDRVHRKRSLPSQDGGQSYRTR